MMHWKAIALHFAIVLEYSKPNIGQGIFIEGNIWSMFSWPNQLPSPKRVFFFNLCGREVSYWKFRQLIYVSGFCMTYAKVFWKMKHPISIIEGLVFESQRLFACVKHCFTILEFSAARITAIILGTQARKYEAHNEAVLEKHQVCFLQGSLNYPLMDFPYDRALFGLVIHHDPCFELDSLMSTNAKNMKWGCPQTVKP